MRQGFVEKLETDHFGFFWLRKGVRDGGELL
jgi:hypothetical protein